MSTIASRMQLIKGFEDEYKKRHDKIWPELQSLLLSTGIKYYHIFLEEATGSLFAVMEIENENELDALPHHPVMKKWWAYMKDIMETNENNSPVAYPLRKVFSL